MDRTGGSSADDMHAVEPLQGRDGVRHQAVLGYTGTMEFKWAASRPGGAWSASALRRCGLCRQPGLSHFLQGLGFRERGWVGEIVRRVFLCFLLQWPVPGRMGWRDCGPIIILNLAWLVDVDVGKYVVGGRQRASTLPWPPGSAYPTPYHSDLLSRALTLIVSQSLKVLLKSPDPCALQPNRPHSSHVHSRRPSQSCHSLRRRRRGQEHREHESIIRQPRGSALQKRVPGLELLGGMCPTNPKPETPAAPGSLPA